jgi:hypothetical protein
MIRRRAGRGVGRRRVEQDVEGWEEGGLGKGDEKNEGGVEEWRKVEGARGWEERGRG